MLCTKGMASFYILSLYSSVPIGSNSFGHVEEGVDFGVGKLLMLLNAYMKRTSYNYGVIFLVLITSTLCL